MPQHSARILFGYGYLRFGSANWTKPFTFSPNIINALIMTVVLLTSSLTMLGGVAAAREGRRGATLKWLGATVLLGSLFAILHLREWSGMLHEGWSLSANPMGGSVLVGALFFSITGLHLLHVISGVVAHHRHRDRLSDRSSHGGPRRDDRACIGTSSIWCGCSCFRSCTC